MSHSCNLPISEWKVGLVVGPHLQSWKSFLPIYAPQLMHLIVGLLSVICIVIVSVTCVSTDCMCEYFYDYVYLANVTKK